MFEALGKAFLSASNDDDERLERRRSRRSVNRSRNQDEINAQLRTSKDSGAPGTENLPDILVEEVLPTVPLERKLSRLTVESEEETDDELIEDREKWKEDHVVLLYMVGYAVGVTNVWRFPFLCYDHGGGAFLIPYVIFLLLCAFPLVHLELIVGQYAQVGAIAAWKLVPLFKGVGICTLLVVVMECINTNTVVAWCLFYLFQTIFHKPLPWISCDNGFGRKRNGQVDVERKRWIHVAEDVSELDNWHTTNCIEFYADAGTFTSMKDSQRLPGSEYFRGRVQRMWKSAYSDAEVFNKTADENGVKWYGIDQNVGLATFNTDTMVCLVICFFIIAIFITKGIRMNNKFIIISVMIPYIVLALLLFRATGLVGASVGLKYLFTPNMASLFSWNSWRIAAEQVLLSTGAGLGVHLTFASHNKLTHNLKRDATITVLVNFFTSILAAIVIFMYMGHVEVAVGRKIDKFLVSGPALAFEIMADVLGQLAHANFYSYCFYFMLFLLGLATSVCSLMCVKTSIIEVLPIAIKYKTGNKIMVLLFVGLLSFFASALCMTRGGLHMFSFYEAFVGSYALLLSAMLFYVGIAWFWGLREIVKACEEMGIGRPGTLVQICWKYVSIIALLMVVIAAVTDAQWSEIADTSKGFVKLDPPYIALGCLFTFGPLIAIPIAAAHALSRSSGRTFKEKLLLSISPTKEHRDIIATKHGKRQSLSHYMYLYVPGKRRSMSKKAKNNQVGHGDIPNINLEEAIPGQSLASTDSSREQFVVIYDGNDMNIAVAHVPPPPPHDPGKAN